VSRLIEIQPTAQELPAELTVGVGDVLRFAASGGRAPAGSAVELLGIYAEGVLGTNGAVMTPLGPPNVVLFRARTPGRATVDVITGDPFRAPATHHVTLVVESGPGSAPTPL
jgi:hypothetical protein